MARPTEGPAVVLSDKDAFLECMATMPDWEGEEDDMRTIWRGKECTVREIRESDCVCIFIQYKDSGDNIEYQEYMPWSVLRQGDATEEAKAKNTFKVGRVQMQTVGSYFREAFKRVEGDARSGYSEEKAFYCAYEADLTAVYKDGTVTCKFEDGKSFDFPWECIKEQLSVKPPLPGWKQLCEFVSADPEMGLDAETLNSVDKALNDGELLRRFAETQGVCRGFEGIDWECCCTKAETDEMGADERLKLMAEVLKGADKDGNGKLDSNEFFSFLRDLHLITTDFEDFANVRYGGPIFGERHCIEVTLISASGLSSSSPYCILQVVDKDGEPVQKQVSSTKTDCPEPVWNQKFLLQGLLEEYIFINLHSSSEEEEVGSDSTRLGQIAPTLQEVLDREDKWAEIEYDMYQGKLKLKYRTALVGEDLPEQPDPPKPEAIGDVIVGGSATVKKRGAGATVQIRSEPEYPGEEYLTGGELLTGTQFEYSEMKIVMYEFQDSFFKIYYYCLTYGRGWVPDFNEDAPGERVILDAKNDEQSSGPGIFLRAWARGQTGQGPRRTLREIMDSTKLIDAEDNEMSLGEAIEGKYTVIFTGVGWCPSCKIFGANFTQWWNDGLKDVGFQVIFSDGDRHDSEESFNEYRKTLPFLAIKYDEWLARGELYGLYGSGNGFPSLGMIDDKGRMIRYVGVEKALERDKTGEKFPDSWMPEVWYPTAEYDELPEVKHMSVYPGGSDVWSAGKHVDTIFETCEYPYAKTVPGVLMQEGEPFEYDLIQKYHCRGAASRRGDDYDAVFYKLSDGRGWVCGFNRAPKETDKSGDAFEARVSAELGTPLEIWGSATYGELGTKAGGRLEPGEEFKYTSKAIYAHHWHNYHPVNTVMYKLADGRGWVGDHGKLADGDESDLPDDERERYIEELDGGGAEVRGFSDGISLAVGDVDKRAAFKARWLAKQGLEPEDGEDVPTFEVGDAVLWKSEDDDIKKGTVGEVARVGEDGKLKVLFRMQLWSFRAFQLRYATEEDIELTKTKERAFGLCALPFEPRVIKELKVGDRVTKNIDRFGGCQYTAHVGEVMEIEKDGEDTWATVKFTEHKGQLGAEGMGTSERTEKIRQMNLVLPTQWQLRSVDSTSAELGKKFEARQAAHREWRKSLSGDSVVEVASWGPSEPSEDVVKLVDDLRSKGEMFEDPDFDIAKMEDTLPEQTKAYILKQPEHAWKGRHPGHDWKRPGEINDRGYTLWHADTGLPHCSGISQGDTADCWFISAVSTLAVAKPELLKHRFCGCYPEVGLYVLSFWKGGAWVEVRIDDRLLTTSNVLIFAQDKIAGDGIDVWLPLLEKAYAKLHGGYASLNLGRQEDALLDLAGAVPIAFTPAPDQGEAILARLAKAQARGVTPLLGVSTSGAGDDGESKVPTGLTKHHQYSVLEFVDKRDEGLPLLMLCRNPYGRVGKAGGYNGPWSNFSEEWTEEMQDILGYNPAELDDLGMFLIAWEDAVRIMTTWRYSVMLPSDFFRIKLQGKWDRNTAGGSSRPERMAANPQYLLTVPNPPVPDMQFFGQLSLEQEDLRLKEKGEVTSEEHFIGIRVYKTEGSERIEAERFQIGATYSSGNFQRARMVSCTLDNVEPGEYVVVPQTMKGTLGKFILGAWVSYAVNLEKLPGPEEE